MARPSRDVPDYPVVPILVDLGATDLPELRGSDSRKIRCPFHDDTTPSAVVTRYGFRCYACGVSGDAIKLLRTEGGMTFADAVSRCAELTGVGDRTTPAEPGQRSLLSDW